MGKRFDAPNRCLISKEPMPRARSQARRLPKFRGTVEEAARGRRSENRIRTLTPRTRHRNRSKGLRAEVFREDECRPTRISGGSEGMAHEPDILKLEPRRCRVAAKVARREQEAQLSCETTAPLRNRGDDFVDMLRPLTIAARGPWNEVRSNHRSNIRGGTPPPTS